jgi:pyruvate dehydrogenase E2 component (dihydrolipoamide acetyltransferase)
MEEIVKNILKFQIIIEVECEMDQLLELRKQLNSSNAESPELKISVNDLIIKASALSLKKIPEANASWTEEAVLKYNNVDISIAVAIEGGLITPIIKNADQKPIGVISEQMKDLASRARKSALKPEEFQGGSFTISNLGMFGVDSFKAIINPPQSCILAIGSTSEKATVKDGKIVIASIMRVTLSADHRVIDGAVGAKFLTKFKEYIEHPVTMLMY